jgi:UDP-N-acetylglucosamine acyltransferase
MQFSQANIHPKANIHETAYIHPTAVIYADVTINANAYIGPYCVIGAPPEIRDYDGPGYGVVIGAGTRLEKHVVVDAGSEAPTIINVDCILMSGVHIGHDCFIHQNCTISAHACLAGHVFVEVYATIGINASIHQHQTIGAYAMVGAGCVIARSSSVPRLAKVVGNPARIIGRNDFAIEKYNLNE